jgi:hypothetical protein
MAQNIQAAAADLDEARRAHANFAGGMDRRDADDLKTLRELEAWMGRAATELRWLMNQRTHADGLGTFRYSI